MSDSLLNKWDQPESDDRMELVFADRFKGYGAYLVRAKYRQSKFIATVLACCFVVLLAATPVIINKFKGEKKSGNKVVRVKAETLDELEEDKKEEKKEEPPTPEPPDPVKSTQYTTPTIDPNAEHEDFVPPAAAVPNPGQRNQDGRDDRYGDDGSASGTPLGDGGGDDGIKTKVDVVANFPGGESAFIAYVTEHFQYPPRCWEEGINGYVLLRFVVDTKGNISQVTQLEGTPSCPEFTTEAIRVLKKSPRWIPAQYNGKFVKAWRQIPIRLAVE